MCVYVGVYVCVGGFDNYKNSHFIVFLYRRIELCKSVKKVFREETGAAEESKLL